MAFRFFLVGGRIKINLEKMRKEKVAGKEFQVIDCASSDFHGAITAVDQSKNYVTKKNTTNFIDKSAETAYAVHIELKERKKLPGPPSVRIKAYLKSIMERNLHLFQAHIVVYNGEKVGQKQSRAHDMLYGWLG